MFYKCISHGSGVKSTCIRLYFKGLQDKINLVEKIDKKVFCEIKCQGVPSWFLSDFGNFSPPCFICDKCGHSEAASNATNQSRITALMPLQMTIKVFFDFREISNRELPKLDQ